MSIIKVARPNKGEDASKFINEAIRNAPIGSELVLERGEYLLLSPIIIEEKEDFVFNGNGSTIMPYFDREKDENPGSDGFNCRRSRNITLKNFKLCASQSVNTAVRILAVNKKYVDVKVNAAEPFNGNEFLFSGMAFTEDGRPLQSYWLINKGDDSRIGFFAGEIPTSRAINVNAPREEIGDQCYRIYSSSLAEFGKDESELTSDSRTPKDALLRPGTLANMLHSVYRVCGFTFKNCTEVTVEDVHVSNFGGFVFVILPRCFDFTFRRVKLQTEDFEHQPYPANADLVHTTGLGGKLIFEDCFVERSSDDVLNIHTQAFVPRNVTKKSFEVIYNKPFGIVSPSWAQENDVLRVYSSKDFSLKGKITVKSFKDGVVTFDELPFTVDESDIISNETYYPNVIIRGNVIRNQRNRAFTFQAVSSLLVENNTIEGSPAAIYISAAFNGYYEAGPAENIVIRNNYFYGNSIRRVNYNGVIHTWVFGSADFQKDLYHIHRNMTIENNTFVNTNISPIYVSLTDRVKISGNKFVDCHTKNGEKIVLRNCTEISCENNVDVYGTACSACEPFFEDNLVGMSNDGFLKAIMKNR